MLILFKADVFVGRTCMLHHLINFVSHVSSLLPAQKNEASVKS